MRRSLPSFRDWDNAKRKNPYGWTYGHGNNREFKSFKTKAQKRDYKKDFEERFYSERDCVLSFDTEEWRDVLRLKEKLNGKGTLEDAVDFYLNHYKSIELPTLKVLLDKRIDDLKRIGSITSKRAELNVSKFIAYSRDQRIDLYERSDVQGWIDSLVSHKMTRETIKGHLKHVRKIFKDAKADGFISHDPTERIVLPSGRGEKRVELIEPEDLRRLLNLAWKKDKAFTALLAILFFTGMRVSMIAVPPHKKKAGEFIRLEMIDLKNKTIIVPAGIMKSEVELIIDDAPECLWTWLKYLDASYFGMPQNTFNTRKNELLKELNIKWPPNLHRRSFGSYLAALRSRDYAAQIMGDRTQSVFVKHYQVPAFKKVAEEYIKITPDS